jgi:hypothetical protein
LRSAQFILLTDRDRAEMRLLGGLAQHVLAEIATRRGLAFIHRSKTGCQFPPLSFYVPIACQPGHFVTG